MGLTAVALDAHRTGTYERYRPETTTLYAVVRDRPAIVQLGLAAARIDENGSKK